MYVGGGSCIILKITDPSIGVFVPISMQCERGLNVGMELKLNNSAMMKKYVSHHILYTIINIQQLKVPVLMIHSLIPQTYQK